MRLLLALLKDHFERGPGRRAHSLGSGGPLFAAFVCEAPWLLWPESGELETKTKEVITSTLNPAHRLDGNKMASSEALTPASPKGIKIKAAQSGVAQFGCGKLLQNFPVSQHTALQACSHHLAEHIQGFLTGPPERLEKTIMHYKNCLRVIFDHTPIVPQTSKSSKGQVLTSLTPNYLCLQCSTTTTEHDCLEHGNETSHRFCTSFFRISMTGANLFRRRVQEW